MKNRNLLAAGVAGLALAAALPAAAQSIDYGSLEQMFNEPVTTSATGSPQRSSQAPVDMDIITAQDIQRSGATDLPTILSRVPGLDVLPWSAAATDIGVRGYDNAMSPRLLVLVNGRQVYLDFYGYTAWSAVPVRLEEIRQIEVVKGPNAALFGFNAVSGVINIITYNPKYDDKSFVTGRVGAHDYKEASAGGTFKFGDRFAGRLSGGVSKQDEFKNSLTSTFDADSRATVNLDTVTELADKLELRVEGGWAHSLENMVPGGSGYLGTKYVVSDVKGTLNWDTKVGALQAQAYQNRVTAKFGTGSKAINKIAVANVQNLFKIGADHTFRVSAEYRKTDMPVSGDGLIKYDVKSAAGMWNWQALPKLSLTTAARYDDLELQRVGGFPTGLTGIVTNAAFDRRITLPSYNLGAVWQATDMDTVRATYARGAQIPSLSALGSLIALGANRIYGGSPTLQPTIVTNYGVSYDRALPQIGGSASVRAFYQKSRDIIGLPDLAQPDVVTPALTVFSYANVSDSKMKGVEVVVKGAYKNGVRWNANYAYTDVEDSPKTGYTAANLIGKSAAYALTTPKSRANLNIGWDNAQWSVDGFVRYQSKYEMKAVTQTRGAMETVGSYGTLAANVARKFEQGFTVAVSGQGLTKSRQRQTSGIEVDRRVFLTLSKTW
ncbi:TonB-dependent receptor [Phenylobacterium sp. LjRoot225]|uniref:TonB-dependent receptor plug domain-containing protein n=1 Tax=Phenylobacterium sp. LjRoot225 TaxID=3342285 RepID=UPI003ED0CC5B